MSFRIHQRCFRIVNRRHSCCSSDYSSTKRYLHHYHHAAGRKKNKEQIMLAAKESSNQKNASIPSFLSNSNVSTTCMMMMSAGGILLFLSCGYYRNNNHYCENDHHHNNHNNPLPSTCRHRRKEKPPASLPLSTCTSPNFLWRAHPTTLCDGGDNNNSNYDHGENSLLSSGHTETERFRQNLEYHRALLEDYLYRWEKEEEKSKDNMSWPKRVPTMQDLSALENDLKFCQRNPSFRSETKSCLDIQFRIGTYYVLCCPNDPIKQMRGYKLMKELAESGHADGMCFFGMILNQGLIPGIEVQPQQAVVWWRRCTDFQRHIVAMYELGVALYTGEGVPENTRQAVKYFRRAAHLGHVGAAYMLGQCLLDGIGTKRDRANALEWLVMAAELGHELARKRVLVVLQEDYEDLDSGESEEEENLQWVNTSNEEKARISNIERRFTIGGGVSNPQVLRRRKTKVEESRKVS